MASALLIVPPLVKYAAGPLLGPSMLAGVAFQQGHEATVLDLNILYLRERLPMARGSASTFVGDHDKPVGDLRGIEREWRARLRALLPHTEPPGVDDPLGAAAFERVAVERAAQALADGPEGAWIEEHLRAAGKPGLVGLSVMFGGQVYWALAVALVARRLWPSVPRVWGGPHITALRDEITADPAFGCHGEGFVFGYAEHTFSEVLDWADGKRDRPRALVEAGRGYIAAEGDDRVIPVFNNLDIYGVPRLTLPAQASRGCAYGRCAYCTYPAIEGAYREGGSGQVASVLTLAQSRKATVSFKDSLVLPGRLGVLAERIGGKVRWSACTKLHTSLDAAFLERLATSGCSTLEVGLETLDPDQQQLIHKRQSEALFAEVAQAAADAGIPLVVNCMSGFPGEDESEAITCLEQTREILEAAGGRYQIEHNRFQLERLSPMAKGEHGVRVVRSWPWSSVLAWEATRLHQTPRRLRLVDSPGRPVSGLTTGGNRPRLLRP